MWLSRQIKPAVPTADADLGMTTITGDSVGVVTRGEVRALPVYGPGGYVWMPESGSAVLVIKGGPGGEERKVSLEVGHQDREGRQRDGLRRLQRHAAHHLRIADHQSRRFLQAGEGRPEFSFRHHKA